MPSPRDKVEGSPISPTSSLQHTPLSPHQMLRRASCSRTLDTSPHGVGPHSSWGRRYLNKCHEENLCDPKGQN